MRRVILVVACIGVLFLALLAFTGNDDGKSTTGTVNPPAWARLLGSLTAPFAPRVDLGTRSISLAPNQVVRFSIGPDDVSSRIGRFALAEGSPAGAAARIVLDRPPPSGSGSSQEICLAAAGQGTVIGCGEATRSEGSIVVGKDGGTLTMQALNNLPVTVVQR